MIPTKNLTNFSHECGKEKPLVSVIMPVYNNKKYVATAIRSILSQTYSNFEFIIIDDCSTDNSWDIIQRYAKADSRIRAYRNDTNLKIVMTRNKGFKLASSDTKYYAIMDSDDVAAERRLELEVEFLEHNKDHSLVGSDLIIINENGTSIANRVYPHTDEELREQMLLKNCIAQPSVMVRRFVIDVIGGYEDDSYDRARDYDLWMRIMDKYKIANLDLKLLSYRVSSTQSKRTHLKETIRSTMQVQRQWLFKKKYFSVRALIQYMLEYVLLLLPKKLVLWLFKKSQYTK